jgi:hypothetical protein
VGVVVAHTTALGVVLQAVVAQVVRVAQVDRVLLLLEPQILVAAVEAAVVTLMVSTGRQAVLVL